MAQQPERPSEPHPSLRQLDMLVGTWNVTGDGIEGQVRFEWMEGGFFFIQHIEFFHDGQPTKGIEYIGYDAESDTLKSHYFASGGDLLEYTWQIKDNVLTIWFGDSNSPAKFTGTFSDDGNTNTGRWEWPGGGYASNMTRAM